MKVYNVGNKSTTVDAQLYWKREIQWLVYWYEGNSNGLGRGWSLAWDGQSVLIYSLSHGLTFSAFQHYRMAHESPPEILLAAKFSDCEADQRVLLKAKQLMLCTLCPVVGAPDCVVADWYEDRGELEKVSILHENLQYGKGSP